MIDQLDLRRMANHLEAEAGASTFGNDNGYGQWSRIVEAIEELAGINPFDENGNIRWEGWLRRAAVASETLAGFDSPRGNESDPGYWARIFRSFALFSDLTFTRHLQEAARDAILAYHNPPPPVFDSILLEDGSFLLLEDDSRILVEG